MERQHNKWVEALLQSGREPLYQILLTTVNVTALEKSVLDLYKIVRLFVNALTPDDKDDLLNRDNLTQPIQRELSEKQKIFLTFFWIFKIFFTF